MVTAALLVSLSGWGPYPVLVTWVADFAQNREREKEREREQFDGKSQ